MFRKNHSNGFSVVGVIIIISVLAIIGVAGGVAWDNSNEDTQSPALINPTPQNRSQQPTNDTRNYLVIEEWGIRITLPEELKNDVTYSLNDKAQRDFGGPVRVDFLSKYFSEGSLKCAVVEDGIPRTVVSLYKEVDGVGGATQDPQPFKRIGDVRYYFSATSCEEAINQNGSDKDRQLLSDLKNAISNTLENHN